MPETTHDDSADIVVRDRNGNYQLQVPVLPALEEDQPPPGEGDGGGDGEGGKDSKSFSAFSPCWFRRIERRKEGE